MFVLFVLKEYEKLENFAKIKNKKMNLSFEKYEENYIRDYLCSNFPVFNFLSESLPSFLKD